MIDIYMLDKPFYLLGPDTLPVAIPCASVIADRKLGQPTAFRLILHVPYHLYRQLMAGSSLFHVKLALPASRDGAEPGPGADVDIDLFLRPDSLVHLPGDIKSAEQLGEYLIQLAHAGLPAAGDTTSPVATPADSAQATYHPLLSTESWLCLAVKQNTPSGEIGYRTFWSYLDPMALQASENAGDAIAEAVIAFTTDWARTQFSERASSAVSELATAFSEIVESLLDDSPSSEPPADTPLLESLTRFLADDDWPYVEMEDDAGVTLAFRGRNGEWTCYAIALEERHQVVFYSLCPVIAPPEKRLLVAEFIARANYGMILGNFELDMRDGELRYKTSIDVEDSRIDAALIRHLVYNNVTIMDQYLPGFLAVIRDDISPGEAIARIEQP